MFRKKIFSSVLIVFMTCISISSAHAVGDKDNPSADDKSVILSDKKESGTERNREIILKDLNRIREEKKLPALNINESLNKAAQDWSGQQAKDNELLAQQNLTDHYPSGWTKAAQTVAAGGKAEDAVKLWKDSPETLKYITDRKINSVGIGVAYAEDGTPYYTVNYAGYKK